MLKLVSIPLVLAAMQFVASLSSNAQTVCAMRAQAIKTLEQKHGETVSFQRFSHTSDAIILEFFESPDGSWTILNTHIVDGQAMSCIAAEGDADDNPAGLKL